MTKISLTPNAATMRAIDRQLGKLEILGRSSALRSAVRQGGNVIAKEWRGLVPVVNKHDGAPTMSKTIKTEVHPLRQAAGFFVKVRSDKPTAHLVELGHELVKNKKVIGQVEPKNYGEMAKASKFNEAQAAIINGLKKAVADATK